MESIIEEILDRLRAGQTLDAKDLLRILNDHNKRLAAKEGASSTAINRSTTTVDLGNTSTGSQQSTGKVSLQPSAGTSEDSTQTIPRHYSKKKLMPFYLRTKERNPELWQSWNITPELEQQLIKLLQVKPRRSASGVATITVITKPWKCGSACIYCPNDLRMPKSYLCDEPACQRAERNYFDPYLQVTSRLRALNQMGHVTDKIELIVLGGTWSDYPKDYQIWFITELFRALNDAGVPVSGETLNDINISELTEPPKPLNHLVTPQKEVLTADHSSTFEHSPASTQTLADITARARRAHYHDAGLSYHKEDLVAFTQDAQRQVERGELTYNEAMISLYETGEPWVSLAHDQHATLDQLKHEHTRNEEAKHRVVGLVVETRPSTITPESLTFLRTLGATKLQMGIQSLDQHIHDINHRPVTIDQIERALDLARLFGFKTHTHFMVNLLGATPESDKLDFKRFVTETPYQPDEIKLYPCALVHGTELCARYETGEWQPYDEETLVDVLVADLLATPGFTRISRMIRDFSAHDIEAGNKKVNLRQLVEARAEGLIAEELIAEESVKGPFDQAEQESASQLSSPTSLGIQEIRHREISTQEVDFDTLSLDMIPYEITSTREFFLQWITPENKIAGFLRLSLPKPEAFETYAATISSLPIHPDEAMIREVHVYGRASSLHKAGTSAQHRGLGKMLIERACQIAKENGYRKINVISAIGTRSYYRKLGFFDNGLYQQMALLMQ